MGWDGWMGLDGIYLRQLGTLEHLAVLKTMRQAWPERQRREGRHHAPGHLHVRMCTHVHACARVSRPISPNPMIGYNST